MEASTKSATQLDADYPLTQAQIDEYQSNGHVLLRGVCPREEILEYANAIRGAVAQHAANLKPMEERDDYGKAFIQVMNLWTENEVVKRFVFSKRFAKIAAQLMGCTGARLYHDQALYKEPGGAHTPWHQDQTYWPLDTNTTVTMWMPLVDISESMGTMHFGSGTHKLGYLGQSQIEDKADEKWEALLADKQCAIANHGAMNAGDATFHAGLTLHGAPGNQSDRLREVMTVIYFPDGTRVLQPDSSYRQNDLDAWIPGGIPGQPAASKLNPLLYSQT